MIKFKHSIFAMPFAFIGALLGSQMLNHSWPTYDQWIWVTIAMVGARSAAMTLNRLVDAQIDKQNPRTASRAIPAGRIKKTDAWIFITISFLMLFFASYKLNMLAVYLLPIAVFFLATYSYTKRFTWACHFILGITIAFSPLGGWVGTTGNVTLHSIVLFIGVLLWIAGFDIIYATQDATYDRKYGLYSIPSCFGVKKALLIARIVHVISFFAFFSLFLLTPLSWFYLLGVFIAGIIMTYEHMLVKPNDLSKVNLAFFTMNGILSIVMLLCTIGDLLLW